MVANTERGTEVVLRPFEGWYCERFGQGINSANIGKTLASKQAAATRSTNKITLERIVSRQHSNLIEMVYENTSSKKKNEKTLTSEETKI